jgi:hypothetical protein
MRVATLTQSPTAFVLINAEQLATPFRIDWERTEELYREAREQARAVVRPAIIDRLAPYWN